jgi:integral membrane protein
VLGTIALILQKVANVPHMDLPNAILWVTHGYLFLVYVIVTLHLGLKLRWPIVRLVLVMAAGTIPTMSFVAEHFVTRDVRGTA